jgi:hypothetical protein
MEPKFEYHFVEIPSWLLLVLAAALGVALFLFFRRTGRK